LNKVLFLTLKVFSATGGIEKVCRIAGKALYEMGLRESNNISIYSMHDPQNCAEGNVYFPAEIFKGFGAAKITFIKEAVKVGSKSKVVFISHINLMLVGWLIKKIKPSVKIILMAHGIEVWKPLSSRQKMLLAACDTIVSVSSFTKEKISMLHNIPSSKSVVLNNCIDPFLIKPAIKKRDEAMMQRYGILDDDKVLLTLTRLSNKDRYKGYDFILDALRDIVKKYPKVKYILAGSYETEEKKYIEEKIKRFDLNSNIIITGFIAEEELPNLFSMADIYVMPSVKEGFGIVFIEAMYYGVPVIAANVDGSTDALLQGKLGYLIPPENPLKIAEAVEAIFENEKTSTPNYKLLMESFGYSTYKNKLEKVVEVK
jgi:phosphatidyl-myo-inositol dimannoside synthase